MIRVALIDDHPLILKIVRQELSRDLDMQIVWESQDSAEMMARIARLAGAPMDKGAGVDLMKKLGDPVSKGEVLYRVHAEFPPDLQFAKDQCQRDTGYTIGSPEDITPYSFGL